MGMLDAVKGIFEKKAEAPPAGTGVLDLMRMRYKELCVKRDEINASIKPMQDKLTKLNDEIAYAQEQAKVLADKIQAGRGGEAWLELKREIGLLARALSGRGT